MLGAAGLVPPPTAGVLVLVLVGAPVVEVLVLDGLLVVEVLVVEVLVPVEDGVLVVEVLVVEALVVEVLVVDVLVLVVVGSVAPHVTLGTAPTAWVASAYPAGAKARIAWAVARRSWSTTSAVSPAACRLSNALAS